MSRLIHGLAGKAKFLCGTDDERRHSRTSTSGEKRSSAKTTAASIVSEIVAAHATLVKSQDCLEPSPKIDALLTGLVDTGARIHDPETTKLILEDKSLRAILPSLRSLCSTAENCLEEHWASYVVDAGLDGPGSAARLREFPYFSNYEHLVRLELSAIYAAAPEAPPSRIAYIGSGPLPLTSLCLLDALRQPAPSPWPPRATNGSAVEILNIDRNTSALEVSSSLAGAIGAEGEGMRFANVDVSDPDVAFDLSGFDIVYIASLVGGTQREKEGIFLNVARRMKPGAVIVTRSAWGLRTCLYSSVDLTTPALLPVLEVFSVVHPYKSVINSVIVAKVRPRSS